MIQLFIFVSIMVLFMLTLDFVINLRDSYRDEYLAIRNLRRRYASMAFKDASQIARSASGSDIVRNTSGLSMHGTTGDSNRKTALTDFFTVGDKCA